MRLFSKLFGPPESRAIHAVMACLLGLAIVFLPVRESWSQSFTRVVDPSNPILFGGISAYWTGCAWVDYDGDGDLDLFATNRIDFLTSTNFLFRNDSGTFVSVTGDPIVTTAGRWFGTSWADYDNDGDLDCYVAGLPQALFNNDGAGGFTRVTSGGLGGNRYASMSGGWADYDNDGNVDLIAVIPDFFGLPPGAIRSRPTIYRNSGPPNYDFVRLDTGAVALAGFDSHISVNWSDFDQDGDQDVFIGTNLFTPRPGNLFRNMLSETGVVGFEKMTDSPLATVEALGRQWSWIDVDNDGDLDGYWTSWQSDALANGTNHFFRNTGSGYTHETSSLLETSQAGSGGNLWGDYDNDGDLDCIETNDIGNPLRYYENDGTGNFTEPMLGDLPITDVHSTGASSGDYDNDGDLDFYTSGELFNSVLFRNDLANGNHWLKIDLTGVTSNRSGIGARVRLLAVIGGDTVWQEREVSVTNAFLGHSAITVHVGLGDAVIADSVVVYWPSGITQYVLSQTADQTITIVECTDTDTDGICDTDDLCVLDPANDEDSDGFCADVDNCPADSNVNQSDIDFDGVGDLCDNCPADSNSNQEDVNENGVGDACECTIIQTGDVNASGSITSADIIAMVNYVFKSGVPPQPCTAAGDVDCGGTITSSDIIYMVNHVFKSGPAPCDVCDLVPDVWGCQ